jgi:putative ABC transport system ATP-binding protein
MILRGLRSGLQARAASEPVRQKPAVVLEDVSKHYSAGKGAVAAVSGVSLEIRPGDLTVLMGPSGSGKTTLLSLMGGILRPTRGRIVVCGEDLSTMPEIERSRVRLAHIGFVFQQYNLFPALTAQQNVEIALDLKGFKGRERRAQAQALLEQVELCDKADAYPADLSGGQKQRIAIARALAGAPTVLLADEPTAALDSVNGRRIIKLFRDLTGVAERAVVVVTHDSRIVEFADRVIRIEDGRIAADAPSDLAIGEPAALTAAIIRRPSLVESA